MSLTKRMNYSRRAWPGFLRGRSLTGRAYFDQAILPSDSQSVAVPGESKGEATVSNIIPAASPSAGKTFDPQIAEINTDSDRTGSDLRASAKSADARPTVAKLGLRYER